MKETVPTVMAGIFYPSTEPALIPACALESSRPRSIMARPRSNGVIALVERLKAFFS